MAIINSTVFGGGGGVKEGTYFKPLTIVETETTVDVVYCNYNNIGIANTITVSTEFNICILSNEHIITVTRSELDDNYVYAGTNAIICSIADENKITLSFDFSTNGIYGNSMKNYCFVKYKGDLVPLIIPTLANNVSFYGMSSYSTTRTIQSASYSQEEAFSFEEGDCLTATIGDDRLGVMYFSAYSYAGSSPTSYYNATSLGNMITFTK